jgi:hypothetical protein
MQVGIRKAALRLGMLASAAVLMGRDEVPTTAEACVACANDYICVYLSAGVHQCQLSEAGTCRPAGGVCS